MLLWTIRHKSLLIEIERKFHNDGEYDPYRLADGIIF